MRKSRMQRNLRVVIRVRERLYFREKCLSLSPSAALINQTFYWVLGIPPVFCFLVFSIL